MAKYYIAFDTKDAAPNIKAVTVQIGHELIRDMNASLPINLRDDPLYPNLVAYVQANPIKRKPGM